MMAGIIETLSWSVDNWASMPQLVREGGRLEWLGMSVCDRVGGWMSGWVGGLVNVECTLNIVYYGVNASPG